MFLLQIVQYHSWLKTLRVFFFFYFVARSDFKDLILICTLGKHSSTDLPTQHFPIVPKLLRTACSLTCCRFLSIFSFLQYVAFYCAFLLSFNSSVSSKLPSKLTKTLFSSFFTFLLPCFVVWFQ